MNVFRCVALILCFIALLAILPACGTIDKSTHLNFNSPLLATVTPDGTQPASLDGSGFVQIAADSAGDSVQGGFVNVEITHTSDTDTQAKAQAGLNAQTQLNSPGSSQVVPDAVVTEPVVPDPVVPAEE